MTLGATTAATATPAAARPKPPSPGPILDRELTYQSPPDECWDGTPGNQPGDPNPQWLDLAPGGTCPPGYRPKVNTGYMWSAARSGDFAYFGTQPNSLCTGGSLFGLTLDAYQTESNVCEFAEGRYPDRYGPAQGDFRTPKVLRVNSETGQTEDITPNDPALERVVGLRGGMAINDLVLMFGLQLDPTTYVPNALVIFAFQGSTGEYLGSRVDTTLASAREGVVVHDVLYTGVRLRGQPGGYALRWNSDGRNVDPDGDGLDPQNPDPGLFAYEVVGQLRNDVGYVEAHETPQGTRLVYTGWALQRPDLGGIVTNGPADIWMSRPINPGDPLTAADANSWESIFSWADFDPDPVIANSIYWGDVVSWRGKLYMGSYQIDTTATSLVSLWNAYGRPASEATRLIDAANSVRAVHLFEIGNPGEDNQRVRLLYGSERLPVFDPSLQRWTSVPNKLGQRPKFGPAGFNGNPFNQYAWTFTVFQDTLYMATFDVSGAIPEVVPMATEILGLSPATRASLEQVGAPLARRLFGGGDLWRMDSPNRPAVAEDLHGYGTWAAHGIRVMVPFEDKGFFYAGTATGPMNLRLNPNDNPGGAQILKLTPGQPQAPLPMPSIPPEISALGDIAYAAVGVTPGG